MYIGYISLLGIIFAAIAGMVVSFLWFSPVLFAKSWMEMINRTEEDLKGGRPAAVLLMFIGNLVMAFVLATILQLVKANTLANGLSIALLLWVALVATVMVADVIFLKKPLKFYLINAGHVLFELLVMTTILMLVR
jgi:hypothetical protein